MSKHVEAEYARLGKAFMQVYGTVHACGNCKYTTTCIRMRIQNLRISRGKMQKMLNQFAKFITRYEIEDYKPNNCEKTFKFIKVYDCKKFKLDTGGTNEKAD